MSNGNHRHHLHVHEPDSHVHEPWIPLFVDHGTQTDFATGGEAPWDLPASWDGGHVPEETGMIHLNGAKRILRGEVRFRNLFAENGGGVIFDQTTDVTLTCDSIQIANGLFQMGSTNPDVRHEIIFTGGDIDLDWDPGQFSRGLMCYGGKSVIKGSPLEKTWVRLTRAPRAGDDHLMVDGSLAGWEAGDLVLIPDSRPRTVATSEDIFRSPQWEERIVASVAPGRINLTERLAFDHPAGEHPKLSRKLHTAVANFSRNTLLRTAEENHNNRLRRAHSMCLGRCAVDWTYAEFRDMGRTRSSDLDSTQFGGEGDPEHVGTNQKGRYAIHLHHCLGPRGGIPEAGGRQFRVKGCSSYNSEMPLAADGFKWGGSVHNAHWGDFTDNVGYKWAGNVFILGEHGNESHNDYSRNYAAVCDGTRSNGQRAGDQVDFGHAGDGFWTGGPWDCVLDDLFAADCGSDGLNNYGFSNPHDLHMQLPINQGDDPYVDGQFRTREEVGPQVRSHAIARSMKRAIIHNCGRAIFNWGIIGYHHDVEDGDFWHCPESVVRDAYHSGINLVNCTLLQDVGVSTRSAEQGLLGGYGLLISEGAGVKLQNCNVLGFLIGASVPDLAYLQVDGGTWDCLSEWLQLRPDNATFEWPAIHHIRFGNEWRAGDGVMVHKMHYTPAVRRGRADYFTRTQTYLHVPQGDYQVWFPEQAEGFDPASQSDPERRAHLEYVFSVSGGRPIAGEFSPADAGRIPGVEALVKRTDGLPPPPPPPDNETAPVISNLEVSFDTAGKATITWNTDEDALTGLSLIEAGVGQVQDIPYGTSLMMTHSVTTEPLAVGQWYEATARAKDAAGNEATAPVGFQVPGGDVDPPPPPGDLKISGMTTFRDEKTGNVSLVFDTSTPALGQVVYARTAQTSPVPDTPTGLALAPAVAGRSLRGKDPAEQHVTVLARMPSGKYWWVAYAFGTDHAEVSAGPQSFEVVSP